MLTTAQSRILAAIARLGENAWMDTIREDSGVKYPEGPLATLEGVDMIGSELRGAVTELGPRRRRCYRLTRLGIAELERSSAALRGPGGGQDG